MPIILARVAGSKVGTVIGVRNKHGDEVMKHELLLGRCLAIIAEIIQENAD